MKKHWTVYYLKSILDDKIFYVGVTSRTLQKRLAEHFVSPKHYLLEEKLKKGAVSIHSICVFSSQECNMKIDFATQVENLFIEKFKSFGHPILNRKGLKKQLTDKKP